MMRRNLLRYLLIVFFVAGKLMTVRQMTGHQNIIKLLSYLFVTINIYHLFTL